MSRRTKRKQKKIINYLIVGTSLSIMLAFGIEEYKDKKIRQQENKNIPYTVQNISTTYKQEEQKEKEMKEYPKEEIPKEYKSYSIIAKLEIPKIELETFVLKTYSEKSLNISVTKFWGANPNQIGNFCIAGHNAPNKNMFHNLRELQIGEKLWLIDRNVGKVEYEIYDIYTVYPEDVKCLSQETEGRREITLITCTNDSKKRIIVKAKEKE